MKRNTGLDLLRIVSMLMVITLHFLGRGKFLTGGGVYFLLSWGIEAIALCAVNVYVLITGYFLSNKDSINIKKLVDFFLQIWCIDLLITFILVKTNVYTITTSDLIQLFLPFISKSNWFFSCYILLYLFHPFLNKLINDFNFNRNFRIYFFAFL